MRLPERAHNLAASLMEIQTMKKLLSRRFALLSSVTLALLLAIAGVSIPSSVHAQSGQLTAQPSTLFNFRVSSSNLGWMLTGISQRGFALNYTNFGSLFPSGQIGNRNVSAGIVLPPASNYTPAAGQHLVPLYQWRVVQSGRTYYYYSTTYLNLGGGYYFEGLVGYVLPANFQTVVMSNGRRLQGAPVNYYYSTRYGYWYSTERPEQLGHCFPDSCSPGGSSYQFQGVGFQLPVTIKNLNGECDILSDCPNFLFDPPYTPPPPTCDPSDEQYCYNSGGSWDFGTCSCDYTYGEPVYR